ncbi:MAG: hypothetical protein J6W60_10820, partial [Treponema sp.]|nr:hypothetical protein [Treponema sp.]
ASSGNDDEYIGSNIGIDSCSLPDGTASWNPLTCNTDEGYFPIKRSNGETCCTKKSSICGCTYVDEDGDGKEDLRCEPYAKEGETPIKYEACAKALLQISKGKKDKSFPIDFACCCGEATKDPNICYTKEKYKSLDWVNGAKLETGEFCVMHHTTNDKDNKVTYSCKDLNKTSDEGVCSTEKDNALANKNGQFICSLSRRSWYEALKYCETVATKEGIIGGQSLFEARNIASILHGGKVGARCSTPLCRGLAITSKMRKLRKACNIQGTGTRLPAFVWSATEDGECQAQAVSLNGMQWPSQLIPKSMPKAAQNSQQGSFYALCRGYCPKNFKSSSDECYCEAGKKIVPSGNDCKECAKKHYSFEDSDGCFACRGVEVVLNEASRKFQVNIENDKECEPYISVPLSKLEEERSLMLGKNVNGDVAVCLCSHKEDGKTVYFSPEYDGTCGCGAGNYKDKSKTTENTCNRCSANSKKKERGLWDSSGMGGLSSCQKCKDLTAVQPTVSDKYCSCLSEEGIYSEDADTPVMDLSCSNKCGEQCKDCGEDTDCMNDCDYCKATCNLSSINDPASTADGRTKAYVEYWKSRTRTRTESCVCDAGYYLNHGKCKPCEEGKISAIGSTKPSHCINPKTICKQDEYLDVDKKDPENSECKPCPNNVRGMTQCSAAGSIGRDACSHRECLRRDRSGCNIFQKMINECTFCEYKCSNNSRTQCEDCTCPGNAKAEIYCDFYGDQKDVGARRLAVCTNTDVDTAGDDLRSYVIWDRAACEDAKRAADPTSEEMPDACLYVDLPGKMSNHISSGATHFLRYNRETDRTQYKCPF